MSGESVGPEGGLLVAGLPFRSFGAESLGPAASLGSVLTFFFFCCFWSEVTGEEVTSLSQMLVSSLASLFSYLLLHPRLLGDARLPDICWTRHPPRGPPLGPPLH